MFPFALPKLRSIAADDPLPNGRHLRARVRELWCALRGNDLIVHIEPGCRICLRCVERGHETPGGGAG